MERTGGVAAGYVMDPPCEELIVFLDVLLEIIELALVNVKMLSIMVCT
jgi:hypothetical protein